MDKLFQAFFATKSSGMGIGLSVSSSIIEKHGVHSGDALLSPVRNVRASSVPILRSLVLLLCQGDTDRVGLEAISLQPHVQLRPRQSEATRGSRFIPTGLVQ